uniref:BPTI/Kunitz inhibitor domain-containing protein n=1 Tax=Amphiprion percula TaxID=161767 RepID=A0A3P8TUG6_AMPPE
INFSFLYGCVVGFLSVYIHFPSSLVSRCQLDSDSGIQCADFVQVWFFDKHIGACSPFWYGGCGGNANRFNTEHECFRTFNKSKRVNKLYFDQDQGGCQNYIMMWFFDTEQNECSRFWYGGCGGNENRFKTQEECENLCLTKTVIFLFIFISSDMFYQGPRSVFILATGFSVLKRVLKNKNEWLFDFRFKMQKLKLKYKAFFLFMIKKGYTKF